VVEVGVEDRAVVLGGPDEKRRPPAEDGNAAILRMDT